MPPGSTTSESTRSILGILHDRYGDKRAPYSLRHTYAPFALLYGRVNVFTLAVNMGTSVDMIEKHYGRSGGV